MYNSCLALTTILLAVAQLIQAVAAINPLFNFTRQASETSLAASDDGSSGAINTSTPFVFYGSLQTSIYVSLATVHTHKIKMSRTCILALMHLW